MGRDAENPIQQAGREVSAFLRRRERIKTLQRLFWILVGISICVITLLHFRGWEWNEVFFLALGLLVVMGPILSWLGEKTDQAIKRWGEQVGISPDKERRSIAYPRVWRFEFGFSVRFLAGFLASRGVSVEPSFFEGGKNTRDFRVISRFRIEEYANRLRVHRWRESGGGVGWGSPEDLPYDWFDADSRWFDLWKDIIKVVSDEKEPPRTTENVPGLITLSGSDPCKIILSGSDLLNERRRRSPLELVLWIQEPSRSNGIQWDLEPIGGGESGYLKANPEDIIFRLPLDVELLGDHVVDPDYDVYPWEGSCEPGRICKTGAGKWAYRSVREKQREWEWWVSLETFDSFEET